MVAGYAKNYINELKRSLDEIEIDKLSKVVEIIYNAYKNNNQIFIVGNGGSASTASHFACDLGKGTAVSGRGRLKVMSLCDNVALVTAISNDYGYEMVFEEQLMNLLNSDDVVIGISASGNSPNILKAIEYAKGKGAVTIGFIGFGGGKLKELADVNVTISTKNYGLVEDVHLILEHIISQYIRRKIESE